MKVHAITNAMVGWFVRKNGGYFDGCGGFGHIDLSDFDFTKTFQVVERLVDEPNGTYYIRVVGAYDMIEDACHEVDFRRDYCENYAPGCWSECEIWFRQPYRYRYYYGDDYYIGDELPWCMYATCVLNECETVYFDDAEECAEYVTQVFSDGYRLFDARVLNAEISYLDTLDHTTFAPRRVLNVPLHMQFFTK